MRGYEAEDAVFRRRRRALSMQEARDLAGKLFAHFGVEPIDVSRTNAGGRGGSWYWYPTTKRPAMIRLAQEAPDWVVCHEVAHYVAHLQGSRGHCRRWAGVYVEAVRVGITAPYARRLELAMERTGLTNLSALRYGSFVPSDTTPKEAAMHTTATTIDPEAKPAAMTDAELHQAIEVQQDLRPGCTVGWNSDKVLSALGHPGYGNSFARIALERLVAFPGVSTHVVVYGGVELRLAMDAAQG